MKLRVVVLSILLMCVACGKQETRYTIIVDKDSPHEAVITINGTKHSFTDVNFQKEVTLAKDDMCKIVLAYTAPETDMMTLKLKKGESAWTEVSSNTSMWIEFTNDNLTKSNSGSVSASSSSGSSCDWHYCDYKLADSTQCKRHVCGCTGYCWEHK